MPAKYTNNTALILPHNNTESSYWKIEHFSGGLESGWKERIAQCIEHENVKNCVFEKKKELSTATTHIAAAGKCFGFLFTVYTVYFLYFLKINS